MLEMLQRYLIRELTRSFKAVDFFDQTNLIQMLKDIYAETDRAFIILIDEWDCLFREYQHDQVAQRKISRLPAGVAQGSGLCGAGIHDRHPAD